MLINTFLLFTCKWIIGIIFFLSSKGKIERFSEFRKTVIHFQILNPSLSKIISYIIIPLEIFIVLSMAINDQTSILGFGVSIFVLIVFTISLVFVLARKINISCNCFGVSNKKISPYDILRNSFLIIISIIGFFLDLYIPYKQASLIIVLLSALFSVVLITTLLNLSDIIKLFSETKFKS